MVTACNWMYENNEFSMILYMIFFIAGSISRASYIGNLTVLLVSFHPSDDVS